MNQGPVTVAQLLGEARALLSAAGIEEGNREARRLFTHATGWSDVDLLSRRGEPVSAADEAAFRRLVARRAAREPLSSITGHCGFWTLDLETSSATLIPRADSEVLIEAALGIFPARQAVRRVLDLGVGSGALLLAALSEFPDAFGIGVDRVEAAARLAQRNARRSGLSERSAFVVGDWAGALDARFDLVLCNPPYIPGAAIAGLMPEVAQHEPLSALDGGPDGLAAYRAVCAALPDLLAEGGVAILELGAGQAEAVAALAGASGLAASAPWRDLAGIPRALPLARAGK